MTRLYRKSKSSADSMSLDDQINEIYKELAAKDAEIDRIKSIIEKWQSPSHIRLMGGEFTVGEMRSVRAVLGGLRSEVLGRLDI